MNKRATLFKVKEPRWSKAFSRTKWILFSFVEQWKEYGFCIAWYGMLWWVGIYSRKASVSVYALKKLTISIDSFFETNYSNILSKYTNNISSIDEYLEKSKLIPIEQYPIWLFWWQGETEMPNVVSKCYQYIRNNNNNVKLITQNNVKDYVNIPNVIYEKVEKGLISYTHFSDILRLTLLAEHGGMWIDVTCYNPYTIPDVAKQMVFCSPHDKEKQCAMKEASYWCDYGGWRSWNIGTCFENMPLFLFCRDMIQAIAFRQKCMPNYFMVDCLLQYAYRKFPVITELIDKMPDCNTKCADLFLLYFNTNKKYNEEEYNRLIKDNWLFKLTYKTIWQKETNGEYSFYGKLFQEG